MTDKKTKKVKEKDYLFISAWLRALEPGLLNDERTERMLSSGSADEAIKVLEECCYEKVEAGNLEKTLSARRNRAFAELAPLVPDTTILDVFRMKYDYHNAKVIIKAEFTGAEAKRLLSNSGRVPAQKLSEAYMNESGEDVPQSLFEAMRDAKEILARTKDPQQADMALDKSYLKEFTDASGNIGSTFMEGYAKLYTDNMNLRSIVRARRMKKDIEFIKEILSPGGNIEPETIIEKLSENESLATLYIDTYLYRAAEKGDSLESDAMTEFELLCDNALIKYFSEAKKAVFGEAVLIAYICAVENEISVIRIIINGLSAGIPTEVIRTRLRELYF